MFRVVDVPKGSFTYIKPTEIDDWLQKNGYEFFSKIQMSSNRTFLWLKHPDGRQAAFVTVDSGVLFHNIQTDEQMCFVLNTVNCFTIEDK